ncbi:hypothetical protein EPA93_29100 [Ktedonosporobacter rubrisoli]|uniref:DUF4878 domain-containing protein n=1 Tax=Ktedonosporobacter rubrisoli TaxID=2509675 RepID=A0A4P6JWT5_KTERU|nr:hypothetical protein [Ktedonosporobacter rubrisoli]QBD79820.1 hypothetical protein EPA93_29100 [Ktedonosporobacter rubrisoli]
MQFSEEPSDDLQQQASQPLYEFPADPSTPQGVDATQSSAHQEDSTQGAGSEQNGRTHKPGAKQPSDEDFRRGLAYPPPPSFFQNMQVPTEAPPLPAALETRAPVASADAFRYVPPGYAPDGQLPPFQPSAPPPRKSRKRVWIISVVVSAILLLSCSLCGWAAYNLFAPAFRQVSGSADVIDNYYSALQEKQYVTAYTYLAPQSTIADLTQDKFLQQAQDLDQRYGAISSYEPKQISFADPDSTNLSRFTITVNVSRPKLQYTALLTLQKINGHWKIVDFNRI